MPKDEFHLSVCEKETILNFSDADKTINIFSMSPTFMRKLEKVAVKNKLCMHKTGYAIEVDVPKEWLRITPPRSLDDAAKKRLATRLRNSKSKNSLSCARLER